MAHKQMEIINLFVLARARRLYERAHVQHVGKRWWLHRNKLHFAAEDWFLEQYSTLHTTR